MTFNPANGWTFSLSLGTGSCDDPPGPPASCRRSQAQGTFPELVAGSPRAMIARRGYSSSYPGLLGRKGPSTPFPGDMTIGFTPHPGAERPPWWVTDGGEEPPGPGSDLLCLSGQPRSLGGGASLPSGSVDLRPPGQAPSWTAGLGGQGLHFCEGTTLSPRRELAQMQETLWVQSPTPDRAL